MSKRTKICTGIMIFALLFYAVLFIKAPFSDVRMKFYFNKDSEISDYSVYYTTYLNPNLSEDKHLMGSTKDNVCQVRFPGNEYKDLNFLRIDMDTVDEYYTIDKVEVSSGGLIKKSYYGSEFFAKDHIMDTNDIEAIQRPVTVCNIIPTGIDPYIVISNDFMHELVKAQSRGRGTVVLYAILSELAIFLGFRKFFPED